MEPVHQAAAVRITVLLPGRASPSAAIGRNTLCRWLSPLLIGRAFLTGRRRAAPCAWKKKKKNSSRSEYQSERSSGDRKRKRKPRSGRTERQTASKLSLLPDLISRAAGMAQSAVKIWRSVTRHSWDYFGHLVSLRPAVNTDVCIFYCFAPLRWTDGVGFSPRPPRRVDLREMSERRRSAAALSSRAHAFSVEALIGSNKKRKLRGWEEKELELSMESLGTDGEDPAHCLDMDPGQCADMHYTAQMSGSPLYHCRAMLTDESEHGSIFNDPTLDRACSCELHALMSMWSSLNPLRESALLQRCRTKRRFYCCSCGL